MHQFWPVIPLCLHGSYHCIAIFTKLQVRITGQKFDSQNCTVLIPRRWRFCEVRRNCEPEETEFLNQFISLHCHFSRSVLVPQLLEVLLVNTFTDLSADESASDKINQLRQQPLQQWKTSTRRTNFSNNWILSYTQWVTQCVGKWAASKLWY